PIQQHRFLYGYTFNKNGIYIAPQVSYTVITDNVLPTGSSTGDVYTQTYINSDRFSQANGQLTLRYSNNKWGSLGASLGYRHTYYTNIDRGTFYTNLNANANYKKLWANAYLSYQRYNHSPFSVTKNLTPECEFIMGWNLSNAVTLQGGVRYLLGMISTETSTENAGYYSYSKQDRPDRRYMVTLGLSINLTSRIQKSRTDKRLFQNESGIELR
ncbi:MAG: hypothetical protein LBS05_11375, partial [Tannerellaceae bacterium]|nr:hypothetical protein [Tannerellaceae bacterium]